MNGSPRRALNQGGRHGAGSPGRDAIILHEVRQRFSTLEFWCSITTGALSGYDGPLADVRLTITFTGVISMFQAELDTYHAIPDGVFTKTPGLLTARSDVGAPDGVSAPASTKFTHRAHDKSRPPRPRIRCAAAQPR